LDSSRAGLSQASLHRSFSQQTHLGLGFILHNQNGDVVLVAAKHGTSSANTTMEEAQSCLYGMPWLIELVTSLLKENVFLLLTCSSLGKSMTLPLVFLIKDIQSFVLNFELVICENWR